MFSRFIQITMFSALFLSACGSHIPASSPTPIKGSLPSLTGAWTISMVHSGGIMGLMRSVEVSSAGSYIVKDGRGNQSLTGKLSAADLANLVQVVNSSKYTPNTRPGACADCFIYNVEISGDGGKFSAQVDDMSIEASGLQPLVTILRGIIERELK